MKKLATLMLLLAGAAAPTSPALAGHDGGPTESKDAVKALWGVSFRPEYVSNDWDFPPIDEIDPGPSCTGPIEAGKTFSVPLVTQTVLGMEFAVSATGGVGLVADDTKMGAEASVGATVKFAGLKLGGDGIDKPIELRFEAATHETGVSSVDASLYAFGYLLDTYTIASTTAPIDYYKLVGYDLPMGDFTGGWSDGFDCSGDDCAGNYGFNYTAVAEVSALLMLKLSLAGVETGTLAVVNAYAGGQAFASWNPSFGNFEFDTSVMFGIIRAAFGSRGRIVPYNGYWLADAAASLSIDDAMGGAIQFEFNVPDDIPLVDDVVTFTPFALEETTFAGDWQYQCTFPKLF